MLRLLLFMTLCVSLLSCNKHQPPDVPVCQELSKRRIFNADTLELIEKPSPTCMIEIAESECGHCVWIVSGKEKFVGNKSENYLNGKSWTTIKEHSVLVPGEFSYAPITTYMINQCKRFNCHKEVGKFKVKFEKKKDQ